MLARQAENSQEQTDECLSEGATVELLDEVRSAWGWVGIEPVELIDDNDFGNLILKDVRGNLLLNRINSINRLPR